MVGDKLKNKINAFCIIAIILGLAAAFLCSGDIENDNIISDTQYQAYLDKLHGTKIHCDYCGGFVFNKYKLEQRNPNISIITSKDTDRIVCSDCVVKAYIKGLDKVLKPKYLKKRPKGLKYE